MIKKWHLPGQKLAVGKLEYKKAIEARLVSISSLLCLCLCNNFESFAGAFFSENTMPV